MDERADDDAPPAEPEEAAGLRHRARLERDRATAKAQEVRDRLEVARARSLVVDAAFGALERDAEIGGGVLAAAVGFRVFLFLVPYVFVWVAGFGVASDAYRVSPAVAAHDAGITGLVARSLGDFGDFSTGERVVALGLGLFATAWAARTLLKTVVTVQYLVWGPDAVRRRVGQTKGAALLVALVTVIVATSAMVSWLRSQSLVGSLLGTGVFMLVPFGAWLLSSWLLPHPESVSWGGLVPGAVVVALGVEVLHIVTIYWISREIAHNTDRYGALGAALALLLWSYLLGRVITGATVANAAAWRKRTGAPPPPRPDAA